MASQSISTLRRLANIITAAVDTLERVYGDAGMDLPDLDQPWDRNNPAEALRRDPDVSSAVKDIVAASAQLTANVCDPVGMAITVGFSVRGRIHAIRSPLSGI
jgi:hypothetical protein